MESARKKTWIILSLLALLLVVGGMVGALVSSWTASAALAHAIQYGDAPTARLLIRRGADPKTIASDGATLLALAARTNDLPLLEEGLARGVDLEAVDMHGMTPLMWASASGWVAGVEALLKAGANPRRVAVGGFTPLNLTTTSGLTIAEGKRVVFRQPAPHPGFARVARILKQHGAQ